MYEAQLKQNDICEAMQLAQSVDYEICSALSYAHQAKTSLLCAWGACDEEFECRWGTLGGEYILEELQQRERLRHGDQCLFCIEEVAWMEKEIFDFCDDFAQKVHDSHDGITTLLETGKMLKSRLHEESLRQLLCLDESRERVSRLMDYLCSRIEEDLIKFVYGQCNFTSIEKWNSQRWQEYSTLLDARVVFGNYQIQESKECWEEDALDHGGRSVALAWIESLLKGFSFETD